MDKVTADPSCKRFWRNNRRFTSLINAALFHGDSVLKSDNVLEADTNMTNILKNSNEKYNQVLRDRDIIKKIVHDNGELYLGLECQKEKIDYLPYKVLLYDSLQYVHQQQIKDHKKDDVRFDIHAVITLVLYEGDTPWDKALTLEEMFDIPEEFQKHFKNYGVLFVDIRDIKEEWIEDEEVRELIKAIHQAQEARGIEEYKEILLESHLTEDAALYYCALMGIENVSHYLKQMKEKEEVSMYKIIEKIITESEDRGMQKGMEQGTENTILNSIRSVMMNLSVDINKSMDILNIPAEKRSHYIQLIK